MKSHNVVSLSCERFSLIATRRFLLLLSFAYFFLPSAVAHYLFGDSFYIYSPSQPQGDVVSCVFGLAVFVWLYFSVPRNISKSNVLIERIQKLRVLPLCYWLFILYLVVAILYGLNLRMHGAGRADLLGAEGDFLFPGMGYILSGCAVYCVRAKRARALSAFVLLCLLEDGTYNGKIFSFLAIGLIFLRLDYSMLPERQIKRIFLLVAGIGAAAVTLISISRVVLAGEELKTGLLSSVYLVGEEFMGVQSTAGWAIEYHAEHLPLDLLTFDQTLQNHYVNYVGHGLGMSPTAYLVGNFGFAGILLGILLLVILGFVMRTSRVYLSWISTLILVLNFQHFLRHGVNVFLQKFLVQIVFFVLLDRITMMLLFLSRASDRAQQNAAAKIGMGP